MCADQLCSGVLTPWPTGPGGRWPLPGRPSACCFAVHYQLLKQQVPGGWSAGTCFWKTNRKDAASCQWPHWQENNLNLKTLRKTSCLCLERGASQTALEALHLREWPASSLGSSTLSEGCGPTSYVSLGPDPLGLTGAPFSYARCLQDLRAERDLGRQYYRVGLR